MTTLAQLERGVVGYWCPMLATTGLRLYDRSGRGNHGTLTSMDAASDWVTASVRGRSGRVLDFNGANDYVIANPVASSGFPSIAGQVWFRSTSTATTSRSLLAKYEFTPNARRSFMIRLPDFPADASNKLSVLISANGTNNDTVFKNWYSNTVVANGLWQHAVFTLKANNLQVFINGKIDTGIYLTNGTVNTVFWDSVTPVFIGANNNLSSTQAFFPGQIAEACIWNRALTAPEIRTLYRLGPGWFGQRQPRRRYAITQAGFNAYWARRQPQIIGGGL